MEVKMLVHIKNLTVYFSNVHTKTVLLFFTNIPVRKMQFSSKYGYSFSLWIHWNKFIRNIQRDMQLVVVLCHWEALNDWLLRPPSLSVLGAGVAEDNCWFQCNVQQCPLEQRAQAAVCNCWIDGFIVSCGLQGKTLAGHTIPASAQLCSCRLPTSFFLMMDAVIPALWMNQKGKKSCH